MKQEKNKNIELEKKIAKTKESSWVGSNFGFHDKLIILGNGFDLQHEMLTSYSDIFDNSEVREAISSFGKMEILLKLLDGRYGAENNEKGNTKNLWSIFEEELGEIIKIFRKTMNGDRFAGDQENISLEASEFIESLAQKAVSGSEIKQHDISYILIHALIDHFKNKKFIWDKTKGSNDVIKSLFIDADVLSFNYNTFHEKNNHGTEYFDRSDALYIHGRISDKTATDYDQATHDRDSQIKLGVYGYVPWTNNNKQHISDKWTSKYPLETMDKVAVAIGHYNNFFWKGSMTEYDQSGIRLPLWEYIKILKKKEGWKEFVFFGHSLSPNDLDIMKRNIDFTNRKITVITKIDDEFFDEEKDRIIKLFPSKNVHILNGIK